MDSLERLKKALRAAFAIVLHRMIGVILVLGISAIHLVMIYAGNGSPLLIYDLFPVDYLFQTFDVAMIVLFGIFGVVEAFRIMRE